MSPLFVQPAQSQLEPPPLSLAIKSKDDLVSLKIGTYQMLSLDTNSEMMPFLAGVSLKTDMILIYSFLEKKKQIQKYF